jgi:hypothetical protein
LVAALAIAAAAGAGLVVSHSPARAEADLIGWTAQANANSVDIVVDNAGGLDGFHPLSEIDLPEDSADFETGPSAHALATIVWPGAVAGNLGSVSGLLPIPSQLAPLLSQLNDPVRAEASYPGGASSATYPAGAPSSGALEMSAHASGLGSSATAGLTDVSVPGLFDLQGVAGSATSAAGASSRATASGSFNSLSLLGGLVEVGATTARASAMSDGIKPTGTSVTRIGAVVVGGHAASVGSDGLIVGPAKSGVGILSTGLVNQLVAALNLKITALPLSQTSQPPAEQITSAGLAISFSLPPSVKVNVDCSALPPQLAQLGIFCHVPDELRGLHVTFTVARATATAIGAPPFAAPGSGSTSPIVTAPGTGVGTVALVPQASPGGPAAVPGVAPEYAPPAAGARTLPTQVAASLSSPVTAGLLAIVLAIALGCGLVLRRVTARLATAVGPAGCPLEDAP